MNPEDVAPVTPPDEPPVAPALTPAAAATPPAAAVPAALRYRTGPKPKPTTSSSKLRPRGEQPMPKLAPKTRGTFGGIGKPSASASAKLKAKPKPTTCAAQPELGTSCRSQSEVPIPKSAAVPSQSEAPIPKSTAALSQSKAPMPQSAAVNSGIVIGQRRNVLQSATAFPSPKARWPVTAAAKAFSVPRKEFTAAAKAFSVYRKEFTAVAKVATACIGAAKAKPPNTATVYEKAAELRQIAVSRLGQRDHSSAGAASAETEAAAPATTPKLSQAQEQRTQWQAGTHLLHDRPFVSFASASGIYLLQ